MRRSVIATLLIVATTIPLAISGSLLHGYAQTTGPQGDEFNYPVFTAPFQVKCAAYAVSCPDNQGAGTWSLDANNSGVLRIITQFGSLLGTQANSSNNARNLILQPFNPNIGFTVTTDMLFPAVNTAATPLGQTAGLIVYQDDDNFIFLGRAFNSSSQPSQLEFVQEINGVDTVSAINESGPFFGPVYLRLTNTGNAYSAYYSTDNTNFTQIPAGTPPVTATATATGTAQPTATAVPTFYTATYANPQIGLFAFGGTNTAINNPSNQLAADFDWFRVGANSMTPGPTPVFTSTATTTALPTSTSIATSTPIPSATSTAVPTATGTAVPTATTAPTATPTSTPIPTPTPVPHVAKPLGFRYVSIWYHAVRKGTFDHVVVQSNKHTTLGIWVHVIFPSGVHYDFYENTDSHGHWSKSFPVPTNSGSAYNNRAIVAIQLWHSKKTVKDFEFFTVL